MEHVGTLSRTKRNHTCSNRKPFNISLGNKIREPSSELDQCLPWWIVRHRWKPTSGTSQSPTSTRGTEQPTNSFAQPHRDARCFLHGGMQVQTPRPHR